MIVGYGAVFGSWSEDLGGFIEQIDPRAFTKTLLEADVRALVNHDVDQLLGRTKAGTLRLSADARGLLYEIDVNADDPDAQSALAKVSRGDLDGSSFSFECIRDEWNFDASPAERTLFECRLVDVGPVTFPAYPDATANARAAVLQAATRAGKEPAAFLSTAPDRLKGIVLHGTETPRLSLAERELALYAPTDSDA